ncbi:MAG: glycosyl transferase family 1 [Cellvibrionales bacterium]|nr:MAG: glycosyl transferase family 1 [Cellvibrionales bacterium]
MRIVIDMQGAQTESRFRGIGRYTLSLTKAIVRNRGEHEIILVLNGYFPDTIESIRCEFNDLLPQENIRTWYALGLVRECEPENTWRREAAELIREAFIASLQPDVVHITSMFEGFEDDAVSSIRVFDQKVPVSVSLYDLIPLLNPEHYLKPHPAFEQTYRRKVNYLRQSSLLLAISGYARQEGIDHLGRHTASIVNISTAVEEIFQPLILSPLEKQALWDEFGLTRPFVLYTGGADERKNLPRLIRAYAQLSPELREAHQLVFAGKIPEYSIRQLQQVAKSAGLCSGDLIFTGYITDDKLVKLYNLCKVYLFPSWHEGFGLPALEAMSCGAAVIGANTSSLPEVIGNEDALFDPFSEEAIALKVTKVLTNENFRQSLIESGFNQAKQFSWDRSAKIAISAFENIINDKNSPQDRLPVTHTLSNQLAKVIPADISEQNLVKLAFAIGLNHPQTGKKQLLIDVSQLVQTDAKTGVQRVVRGLLKELLACSNNRLQVEPVYATTDEGYRYARHFNSKFMDDYHGPLTDEPIEYQNGDVFLGLDLQHHVVSAQQDFYQQLRRDGVQVQFVVYDLLPILMPQAFAGAFPEDAAEMHSRWLAIVAESDGALCISKAVADEVGTWVNEHEVERLRPFNISWFHLGADVENSGPTRGIPDSADKVLKTIEENASFLMVGTIEPRKGHAQTLSAFEQLWSEGVDVTLVIVGQQGWVAEELIDKLRHHPVLGKHLFWLEGISDEYLEKVYAASTCLIAASEGEGFGLPLIEAAQHKLPIIARDIPVFREIAGEHAFYFDNSVSHIVLVKAIKNWLPAFQSNNHPKPGGIPLLTWERSCSQLLTHLGV